MAFSLAVSTTILTLQSASAAHLVVMMYVRFPLPLRNVEDLLHERGIDITHETDRISGTELVL